MDWITLRNKAVEIVKKYRYAFLVLLIGLALMLIPSRSGESTSQPEPTEQAQQEQPDIARQLEEILTQIQGAGKVSVMLTVASGEKTIYQSDVDLSGGEDGTSRSDTVIITDENRAEKGLVQQVNPPVYQGAVIVCQGADSASVRLAIVEAVSKVTGLSSNRISVLKMK